MGEMTMNAGNMLAKTLLDYFNMYKNDVASFEHVGDMEHYKVLLKIDSTANEIYLIVRDDVPIAYFAITRKEPNWLIAKLMHVDITARQTGIASMFLLYLKRQCGGDHIEIGDIQSADTIAFLKRIHLRFNTYWIKGDEKVPYDPNTTTQYYDRQEKTGWTVILENHGDFSDWPRFFNQTIPDLKQFYEGFLHDVDGNE